MVLIEIDDEVWDLYKKAWALFGMRMDSELIKMLTAHMRESSINVLYDAENSLLNNEPEALLQREIGLMKEHAKIMRLYCEENMSLKEIAKKLRLSKRILHEHISKHNKDIERNGFCESCRYVYSLKANLKVTRKGETS